MSHFFKRIAARKPLDAVQAELHASEYKRALTAFDLTMLGVGGIIGAGIFVLTGKAARENAGPGIIISFIISGIVCSLACLCYAELGSTLPVSGSAYSFTYAALGEVLAWIVGWDLMLEYLVGAATVAVGWGVYLDIFIAGLVGKQRIFDPRYSNAPFVWHEENHTPGKAAGFYMNHLTCLDGSDCIPYFNIPAFAIVIALTIMLCYGVRESTRVNNILVSVKMIVCAVFVFAGIKFINPANYVPFVPPEQGHGRYGVSGIFQGSVAVFFAYIGFDAVTTTAQEAANPQRDLPIGIIGSLAICTVFYVAVSAVLTGMVNYSTIDLSAPVGQALIDVGMPVLAVIVSFGVICGLTSVMLVLMIGQPRILYAISLDGLLPAIFSRMSKSNGTPYFATIVSGAFCALLAGLLPVDLLGNLTSVGTLSAFFLVSVSTLVLRITEPDLPRKFEIPGGFWFGGIFIPFLSAFFSIALFSQAAVSSISRVFIWMAVGLLVYLCYGYRSSKLGKQISGKMSHTKPVEVDSFSENTKV
ncbi:hypothetical protein BATDEDRAFT_35118 [Batrachochytrium dendrobatidis JAM81]|uniref:Cationic amino acid transporter C-terminal domain-containing protein n=2 Tax=Batrachochytrium dendrobatidis TaxID=109871 RepID=F4P3G0_BATDJ|nr:uncharacterized protein BATDEDRAFT_35118 [Batrachochytrium dendrobatidis JAM81]EGF80449.1 hypothetical protein BATDEDRAFT_35118 [Batrachochytrium dendrobatidis JAM81]KAJ8326434.1 hypothetical protein O5D80_005184 [Batrachochytrium dendrobatidis]KAK5666776.1 hypothetical protein QVD99_006833 [Batrachochytrium dendrobatidis]OAJ41085.1 hypothetical protein BDEG_24731 [Batrachochytrium dendrobatidis JEL423]|eukprot:XP_006679110.1 hypothetical protein BATDEDRAFT_35118 [Batrachochytrium dendrobatidis JAM81]